MKIRFLQDIEMNRQNSLWYGGDVVKIVDGNFEFIISATGDVVCDIFDYSGNVIQRVKDKSHHATFYDVAVNDDRINTDEKLNENADYQSFEYNNKDVNFSNTNWWEVFIYLGGEFVDSSLLSGEERLCDFLADLMDNMNYLKQCALK